MLSITDRLLRHSMASGVSGVTVSTPSAAGGDLSLLLGAPAVSASFSRCWEEDLEPALGCAGAMPAAAGCCRRPKLMLRCCWPLRALRLNEGGAVRGSAAVMPPLARGLQPWPPRGAAG